MRSTIDLFLSANPLRVTKFIHKVSALQQKVAKRSLEGDTEHDIKHKTLPINNSSKKITLHAAVARRKGVLITSCMNLLQTARISLLSVALNIITCFSWGVLRKISWTSLLMSETSLKDYDAFISRCQNKEFIFFPMV